MIKRQIKKTMAAPELDKVNGILANSFFNNVVSQSKSS